MSAVAIARWTLGTDRTVRTRDACRCRTQRGLSAHQAAGGDCDRVVIVDGLWGAWRRPGEEIDAFTP